MAKLEQQMLHDFAMDKIFTPENAKTATAQADKMLAEPAPFAKGDKVRLALSLKRPEENDDHEIIGFYSNGEVIDENKASPYNNSYGVRVRNLRTGKDYPIMANDLKRIEQEPEKITNNDLESNAPEVKKFMDAHKDDGRYQIIDGRVWEITPKVTPKGTVGYNYVPVVLSDKDEASKNYFKESK